LKDDRVRLAMESDREFKDVLEQSIEPSLSSESVVIAGGGVDPRNEPSPSPERPIFTNFQLGSSNSGSSMNDGTAADGTVQAADSVDDHQWQADFESPEARSSEFAQSLESADQHSSDDED